MLDSLHPLVLIHIIRARQGAFVPAKFEKLFAQFDQDGKGGLTWREGLALMKSNRDIADPFGTRRRFPYSTCRRRR